jgi:hypothetical protein
MSELSHCSKNAPLLSEKREHPNIAPELPGVQVLFVLQLGTLAFTMHPVSDDAVMLQDNDRTCGSQEFVAPPGGSLLQSRRWVFFHERRRSQCIGGLKIEAF